MTAVDREMIDRVKAEKRRRRSAPNNYQDRPRLAFIVHSFNRISNIEQLVGGLRGLGEHELVVCEDGSLDGSHEKWMSYLHRPNDFLIHSNDLHEIRILDRALRFARADSGEQLGPRGGPDPGGTVQIEPLPPTSIVLEEPGSVVQGDFARARRVEHALSDQQVEQSSENVSIGIRSPSKLVCCRCSGGDVVGEPQGRGDVDRPRRREVGQRAQPHAGRHGQGGSPDDAIDLPAEEDETCW